MPIDLDSFAPTTTNLEVKYGLPESVEYCARCVVSNQRPNSTVEFLNSPTTTKTVIGFSDGVCDACRVADRKAQVDWSERENQLWSLCDDYRSSDGSYDCVVPGSGGKDSFYASHILKTKFGMHPLTVTWAPHLYTIWGRENHDSWIHAGHDNITFTPNGRVHRLLTRIATQNLLHPFQPFIIGQKLFPPRLAEKLGIGLVFYGENEAEYGNPSATAEHPQRDSAFHSVSRLGGYYLGGMPVEDILSRFQLEESDLQPYLPSKLASETTSPEIHYLGYYLKWHPQSCYYYAVEHGGFIPSPERNPGTYSKYSSIDDKLDDLHWYTTGVKFGIGRATFDAAQEIRSGDITRDEGVALVKKFDHEFPSRFISELMDYLSLPSNEFPTAADQFARPLLDKDAFVELCDSFRSPHLWQWDGEWVLRNPIKGDPSIAN